MGDGRWGMEESLSFPAECIEVQVTPTGGLNAVPATVRTSGGVEMVIVQIEPSFDFHGWGDSQLRERVWHVDVALVCFLIVGRGLGVGEESGNGATTRSGPLE